MLVVLACILKGYANRGLETSYGETFSVLVSIFQGDFGCRNALIDGDPFLKNVGATPRESRSFLFAGQADLV